MTILHVIGVDPGPTTGITTLHWKAQENEKPPIIWHGYQCDAGSASGLLMLLLHDWEGAWTAGQIEHFVHGNLPNSPTTVRLENELAAVAEDFGLKLARRPMAAVKPWASDTRMIKAGAWASDPAKSVIPAKMVDARAAARHCLMAAVHDAGVPDPLSRKGRPE